MLLDKLALTYPADRNRCNRNCKTSAHDKSCANRGSSTVTRIASLPAKVSEEVEGANGAEEAAADAADGERAV